SWMPDQVGHDNGRAVLIRYSFNILMANVWVQEVLPSIYV
ncbi:MAG: hypothetical protein QG577_1386, partial [Thermodesulfobacteriota bacterium]|nr:hypothetical protein [Thermodesulfobacteriota bacterium]